jgi:MFS family permease
MTFVVATNGLMQLSTEPAMRGRVMALRVGVALGATPIGAPTVGWIADRFGPRWALAVGAASGFTAVLAAFHSVRRQNPLWAGAQSAAPEESSRLFT